MSSCISLVICLSTDEGNTRFCRLGSSSSGQAAHYVIHQVDELGKLSFVDKVTCCKLNSHLDLTGSKEATLCGHHGCVSRRAGMTGGNRCLYLIYYIVNRYRL